MVFVVTEARRHVARPMTSHPIFQFKLAFCAAAGKTTLLRLIAGLEESNAGSVLFGGKPSSRPTHKGRILSSALLRWSPP